jgi:hypothetical protein
MKTLLRAFWLNLGIVTLLLVSCSINESSVTQANTDQASIGINARVSDCGGFQEPARTSATERRSAQCHDEVLVWRYDRHAGILLLSNQDVWLNCCGERHIGLSFNSTTGYYEMHETDAPQSPGGRCSCMCFFDFDIELPNISVQPLPLEIFRHVTDHVPEQIIWNGTLDLQAGSGRIVIQSDVGWCQ